MARTINSGLGRRGRKKRIKRVLIPHIPVFFPTISVKNWQVIGSLVCPIECTLKSLVVLIGECPLKAEERPELKVSVVSVGDKHHRPSSDITLSIHKGLNVIDMEDATLYEYDLLIIDLEAKTSEGVQGVRTSLTLVPSRYEKVKEEDIA